MNAKAERLSALSRTADNVHNAGGMDNEQHKDLKGRIREAQMDNLFAAMAAFCKG